MMMNPLQEQSNQEGNFENFIGKSSKIQAVYELIRNVATSDSSVLILGESGTGKELIAKAIHRNSLRKNNPFIVINCAAMPETLFESELFGYVRGAFTGASVDKAGLFEMAHGGTVFLDEIGEIPLATQVKLLRVIQEGEIRRLGENESRYVNVRFLAATHNNLSRMIEASLFREDLYYRLNVISIHVPPLRERPEDIPLLAEHFLRRFNLQTNKDIKQISTNALQTMQSYSWPGNIRELENVMERAVVLASQDTIATKNLPSKVVSQAFYVVPEAEANYSSYTYKEAKKRALNIFNRSYIMALLEKTEGNITQAAEKSGMDRSNFKKIIRKYLSKKTGMHYL